MLNINKFESFFIIFGGSQKVYNLFITALNVQFLKHSPFEQLIHNEYITTICDFCKYSNTEWIGIRLYLHNDL